MTALILHGIGGHAGIHWQQWLHDELTARSFRVAMPDLPLSDRPDRASWLTAVKGLTADVDSSDLTIVAHSLGVVTALDFIAQASTTVKRLVSVSGFAYDYGAELNGYFMTAASVNLAAVRGNLSGAAVFYGDDDPYVPQAVLAALATELQVTPNVIPAGGHLNSAAGYVTFPQVLEAVLTGR